MTATGRRWRHVIVMVCLVVSLVACAESVDGTPTAQPIPQAPLAGSSAEVTKVDYSSLGLTDDQQTQLADMARWRTWDPCSLIDRSTAAELGVVEHLYTPELDKCSVRYKFQGSAANSATWSVYAEVGTSPRSAKLGYRTDSLGGVNVSIRPPDDISTGCAYLLPLSAQRSVKISANWTSKASPAPRPACDAAKLIATPALQLLQHPKLRREAHSWPDTPLVLADPCGGVPALAKSQSIILDVDRAGLYECWYSAGPDRVLIQLRVGSNPVSVVRPPQVLVQIGEYSAVNKQNVVDCAADMSVGKPVPADPGDRLSSPSDVFSVYASAGTCAAANAVLLATAEALPE